MSDDAKRTFEDAQKDSILLNEMAEGKYGEAMRVLARGVLFPGNLSVMISKGLISKAGPGEVFVGINDDKLKEEDGVDKSK